MKKRKPKKYPGKRKLLLIDGENLLHRSFHKFINLKTNDGVNTGAIFGFFKSLHSLIFRFNPTHVVITFDNGRSKHRLDILPEYKDGRGKNLNMDYESLHKQKKVIMKILKYLNIVYIFDKGFVNQYEGDDYLALVNHLYHGKVVIVSSDKDFNQLISKRTKQMNPSKDILLTLHNCKEVMGYAPMECVDFLTLVGDTSDNISGYHGIGEKKARAFLDLYGSIRNYIIDSKAEFAGINRAELSKLYSRNEAIIHLYKFLRMYPISIDDIPVIYNKGDKIYHEKLKSIFEKYSLNSLKSEDFISVFKNLKRWEKEESCS